jgi:hypothetical protein
VTARAARLALVPRRALRPHEEVDADRVKRLADAIREDGALSDPVVADEGTRVILDGHHRHAALSRLDCRLVPCYLVDYLDPTVQVERWSDGRPMDKREVLQRGLGGDLLPRKTSRHRTLTELPPRATPLAALRPEEGSP